MECEVFQNALPLHVYYFTLVMHEIVDGEIFLERVVDSVETALLEPGKVERGFAKSLAGDSAGVDATAAHMLGALDDGNAFAEIGGLGAALFTSRAAADHDEIESIIRSHEFLRFIPRGLKARPAKSQTLRCETILEQDGLMVTCLAAPNTFCELRSASPSILGSLIRALPKPSGTRKLSR